MKKLFAILLSLTALSTTPAQAVLNVLACEPEWASLTYEIAGDRAKVTSATSAMQDPHHIEARPALIAQARRADLVVCTGAELEIGWLPLLQRESGNAHIQSGQPGYFEAASAVRRLEKPAALDRSMGDVLARRQSAPSPGPAQHYESGRSLGETVRRHRPGQRCSLRRTT